MNAIWMEIIPDSKTYYWGEKEKDSRTLALMTSEITRSRIVMAPQDERRGVSGYKH